MLSLSALTITLLATVSATTASNSYVKDNQVHVRFYDLSKIYGPLKFYVSANNFPGAGCSTCPDGTTAEYVVPPDMVYQSWPQGGKYLEVRFPTSAVGNLQQFYYTAVTCLATEDRFLGTGAVPTSTTLKGRR